MVNRSWRGAGLALLVRAAAYAQNGYGAPFRFSGAWWVPKIATAKTGPGPNLFSPNNVLVDAQGRLHLRITKTANRWQCAEAVMVGTPGYGTYRFVIDGPLDNFDPHVVLGFFTWNDTPDFNHREIDIEVAKWGVSNNTNGWYTVQPYDSPGNQFSFRLPAIATAPPASTHMFQWLDNGGNRMVYMKSWRGDASAENSAGAFIADHVFTAGVPPSGGENPRINFWLFRGRAPKSGTLEVIVRAVEFPGNP